MVVDSSIRRASIRRLVSWLHSHKVVIRGRYIVYSFTLEFGDVPERRLRAVLDYDVPIFIDIDAWSYTPAYSLKFFFGQLHFRLALFVVMNFLFHGCAPVFCCALWLSECFFYDFPIEQHACQHQNQAIIEFP